MAEFPPKQSIREAPSPPASGLSSLHNLEEPLDVRLCRRTSVHHRIGVSERQILALPRCENRERITGHAIHRFPRQRGISDEHTLPGGPERGGTRAATRLSSLLSSCPPHSFRACPA